MTANEGENEVKITRARCDSLKIYDVTEGELAVIERGSPNSVFFNFAIFLLSVASSFLVTLLTVDFESIKLFAIFVAICVLGFMVGLFLLILWYRNHNDFHDTIKKIKDRLKEEVKTDEDSEEKTEEANL